MDEKHKILIVGYNQMPSRHLLNECKYLAEHFDISILSPFEGHEKIEFEKISIDYVYTPNLGNSGLIKKINTAMRMVYVVYMTKKFLKSRNVDLIYIREQINAFLFRLYLGNKYKYVVQMYAQGVHHKTWKNKIHDAQVRFNALFFIIYLWDRRSL